MTWPTDKDARPGQDGVRCYIEGFQNEGDSQRTHHCPFCDNDTWTTHRVIYDYLYTPEDMIWECEECLATFSLFSFFPAFPVTE